MRIFDPSTCKGKGRAARCTAAMLRVQLCLALLLTASSIPAAEVEWPQYRADAERSGAVDAALPAGLSLHWSRQARHQPAPAWLGEDMRMPFDRACQPVIAGGMLYYGSSVDCKVYALDAASGAERWTFFTGGPVRFAPAAAQGRLFVASDDGRLYCLDARDGKLLWERRGGPGESRVLGNGAMVSRWPARGGPVVRNGVVYFGAGIWPTEGIYLYALDAASGRVIWCNDDSGGLEWDQPHRGSRAFSGVAPQGHLAVTEKQLLVPNGRGVPAVFNRVTGKLEYFHLQTYGKPTGGAGIVAAREHFFNGGRLFDAITGLTRGAAPVAELVAAAPDRVVFVDKGQLTTQRWVEEEVDAGKGVKKKALALRSMPPAPATQLKTVPGRHGEALAFTDSDYLETPSFGFDYNNITIAVWVKPDRLDGRFTIFDNRNVKDCPGIEIGRGSSKSAACVSVITPGVFAAVTGNNSIGAGRWHHIAYTRSGPGKTHKIYVDGVEQKLVTARDEAFASTPTPKDIGRRGNGKQNFQGAIDELAVYNRALSGEEIASVFKADGPLPVREGLVLDMPMDARPADGETKVADLSGQAHHGVLFTKGALSAPHEVSSLIMIGDAIVLGGPGRVSAMRGGKTAWSAEVDGNAFGLAYAGNALYVSTDRGMIYCFGEGAAQPLRHQPQAAVNPYGDDARSAAAAAEIIRQTGIKEGYAADLGCGDGALAYELARKTNLRIVAVDADPERVRAAREKLDAAGLYGSRVTVLLGEPARSNLPNYFADLVVSGRVAAGDGAAAPEQEAHRLQRPWGGAACFGGPGALTKNVRGALEGSGDWTHLYCDPANTAVSHDTLVRSPLGMLWFRDYADLALASRHGRPPAPLFSAGRLFIMGRQGLHAIDAYNGRQLWDFAIPDALTSYDQEHLLGTAITGGSFCLEGGSLYARTRDRCLRVDVATGAHQGEFTLPGAAAGEERRWGFLAVAGGTLFGSEAIREHVVRFAFRPAEMPEQLSESRALYAMDAATGRLKWCYTARHSIRHNTIAIGAGRVFLIDRPPDPNDLLSTQAAARKNASWSGLGRAAEPRKPQPPGELLALDAETGQVLWRDSEDVFATMLALSVEHDLLLLTYQRNHAFRLPSELGGRMAARRASDGKHVWETAAEYNERPIINGRTIYAQPGAWDLLTGALLDFKLTRSYGCGTVVGSKNLLAFRSGVLGFRDLTRPDSKTENYGGIRPGCWINAILAGGLLLQPDATEKCTCSYLNKCFIALQPMGN